MKNRRLYLSIIVSIVFILLLCACGSSSADSSGGSIFGKTTIDAKDYIVVNFGKYDGYSTPEIEVDFEGLSGKIDAEKFNEFKNSLSADLRFELSMYDNMTDVFEIELLEEYENVSNGDKIVVKIMADSYLESEGLTLEKLCNGLGIKFKTTEVKFTVTGLEKAENVIDIFEGIEQYIVYEGANGNGRIGYGQVEFPDDYSRQVGDLYFSRGDFLNSVKIVHNNIKIGEISYHVEGEKLSGGDVIEITTFCPTNTLADLGYIVAYEKKKTTVPDLGEYITSQKQLSPDILEAIRTKIMTERGVEEINKLYFAMCKPGVECTKDSTACIMTIVYQDSWLSAFRGYCVDTLYDIIIKPDGTIVVEEYNKDSYTVDTIEEAEGRFNTKEYEFVEIK